MNHVTLIGNIGQAPEIRHTQAQKKVAKFSLATTKRWRDRNTGERQTATTWHNCVVFQEGLAGVVEQYVKKGSKIAVQGSIENRSYEKDGVTKYVSEIIVRDIELLDSRSDGQGDDSGYSGSQQGASGADYKNAKNGTDQGYASSLDDDVPF